MFVRYTQDCMEGSKKRLFVLSLHKYNKENHDNIFDSVHKSYTQVSSKSKGKKFGLGNWYCDTHLLTLRISTLVVIQKRYALPHHQSFLDN